LAIDLVVSKMKFSLRTKLSVSYVLVALLLVAVISYLANFLMEKQFKNYVIQLQEQKSRETVNLITQQYKVAIKGWEGTVIDSIGVSALAQGIVVKVKDTSGHVVWDATVHNGGMCNTMLAHMAQNMARRYPNFKGGYVETSYPVTSNFIRVGTVDIGYYGPYYFTDNDIAFISTLNKIFI
jgi:two-component system, OmpR family, sensor histidine kinase BaeS